MNSILKPVVAADLPGSVKQVAFVAWRSCLLVCIAIMAGCSSPEMIREYKVSQAPDVGLSDVTYDDAYTYLEFAYYVPEALLVFGPQGQRLAMARSGKIVAVEGRPTRMVARLGGSLAYVEMSEEVMPQIEGSSSTVRDRSVAAAQLRRLTPGQASAAPTLLATSAKTASSIAAAGLVSASHTAKIEEPTGIQVELALSELPAETEVLFDANSNNFLDPQPNLRAVAMHARMRPGVVMIQTEIMATLTTENERLARTRTDLVAQKLEDLGVTGSDIVAASIRTRMPETGSNAAVETRVLVSFRQSGAAQ